MIEHFLQFSAGHELLDLALILLGFGAGFSAQLKTPIMLTIFMIRMLKWWFETHPHGKEIAEKTDFNEEFERLFGVHLHDKDGSIPSEPKA